MELIRALALARLVSLPVPTPLAYRLPQPPRLPIARSRGFRHAWSTTQWSDDSTGTASHFADAYRVASLGATREPVESSWGYVLVFGTVPSANTLVRWVNENAFAPIVRARPCPTFDRPVRLRGGPHRLRPGTSPHALQIPPHGGHPALRSSRWVASGSPWLYPAFAFVPHIGFSIPPSPSGQRGITPAFAGVI